MNTLGMYFEPMTRQHVNFLFYQVQPKTMRKNSQFRIVERSFYMDDFFYSAGSIQDAESLKRNHIALVQNGGFNIPECRSNSPELCE